ncbi:MAG: hypothetical protein EOO57_01045 [Hymenobacter sp.]|nr:MAG: hypothetical protein EOO57_01045 [Hymenobacter sp.]
MGYDVQLYRWENIDRERQYQGEDFFADDAQVLPFTPAQAQALHQRLLAYGYQLVRQAAGQQYYLLPEAGTSALLTPQGLFFSAGPSLASRFEAGMTASEFTDTGEFAKYDPQAGGWEEPPE